MHQRKIGKSDLQVGEIGLGCWQFSSDFGRMEASLAGEIMTAAVESGTDFFDTADVYGSGWSESLIGGFLRRTGRPVVVATKFGRGGVYPDGYTEEALRTGAVGSLKRLGVEVLDLLQLHCIPMKVMQAGEIFEWLRRLKTAGKIRHFGASVETVDEARLCLQADGITSLQIIFNIFRQKPIAELFPAAQARGVGLIIRLPLASGLLSGKFTRETHFVESDHRNYNRDGQAFNVGETFAGLPFEKGVELADGLKPFVPAGMSMAQMTLRWILDFAAVSVIIPGATSPAQARANALVSDLAPLPQELHRKLADYYKAEVHQHIRGAY
jgi:aryl-alcohol dehydrogenase-like predicted oxidoreductase